MGESELIQFLGSASVPFPSTLSSFSPLGCYHFHHNGFLLSNPKPPFLCKTHVSSRAVWETHVSSIRPAVGCQQRILLNSPKQSRSWVRVEVWEEARQASVTLLSFELLLSWKAVSAYPGNTSLAAPCMSCGCLLPAPLPPTTPAACGSAAFKSLMSPVLLEANLSPKQQEHHLSSFGC